jgi:hypothetical protein
VTEAVYIDSRPHPLAPAALPCRLWIARTPDGVHFSAATDNTGRPSDMIGVEVTLEEARTFLREALAFLGGSMTPRAKLIAMVLVAAALLALVVATTWPLIVRDYRAVAGWWGW